jgi:hypothetical protein
MLFSTALLSLSISPGVAGDPPACPPDARVSTGLRALEKLREFDEIDPIIERHFLHDPRTAACHIIGALEVVGAISTHTNLNHRPIVNPPAWRSCGGALALYRLTGGKSFHVFTREHEDGASNRWTYLELAHPPQVSYCAFYEKYARGYFAPKDAQSWIIALWRKWLADEASAFPFQPLASIFDKPRDPSLTTAPVGLDPDPSLDVDPKLFPPRTVLGPK